MAINRPFHGAGVEGRMTVPISQAIHFPPNQFHLPFGYEAVGILFRHFDSLLQWMRGE